VRLVAWGALIAAGVLLATATALFAWHRYESAMLNRADGVVVRQDSIRVRFSTTTGREIEFGAPGIDARVGDTLHVLYDPMSPTDARVRSFRGTWLVTSLLAAIGLLLGAVASWLWWLTRPLPPRRA